MLQWHGESRQAQDQALGADTMAAGSEERSSPSLHLRFAERTDFPPSALTSKFIKGREHLCRQTPLSNRFYQIRSMEDTPREVARYQKIPVQRTMSPRPCLRSRTHCEAGALVTGQGAKLAETRKCVYISYPTVRG